MKEESSFREKLDVILDKHHLGCCGGDYCEWSGSPDAKNFKEAHKAIIDLVESVVPDERHVPPIWDGSKASWDQLMCDVWNDCRQELLSKIKL